MSKTNIETYYPKNRAEWRSWLEKNHQSEPSIWLIYFKVSTKIDSINWSEAVDEALCFGWIDSTKKTIDTKSYKQYFCPRKPNSIWSKINKDKVAQLIENNQMTKAGFDSIEIAKKNGSWTLMDEVEKLIVPENLQKELDLNLNAKSYFLSLSNSKRKELLAWIVMAKRAETKEKRIKEIVECAGKNQRPKNFV